MFLFYTPEVTEDSLSIEGDELRHAVKTLRKRVGDEIWSTDGEGCKYKSRITTITKSHATLQILERELFNLPNYNLHLAIALTKNANRLEWFLEKATEIGVQTITPLISSRTEKKSFKKERGDKIVIAAMKQSLRYHLPVLNQAASLEQFLEGERNLKHQKFVGHYKSDNKQLKDSIEAGKSATILIGPEGDFTESEISAVTQAGFSSINLGNHRLRTETAGVVACHTFNIINNA